MTVCATCEYGKPGGCPSCGLDSDKVAAFIHAARASPLSPSRKIALDYNRRLANAEHIKWWALAALDGATVESYNPVPVIGNVLCTICGAAGVFEIAPDDVHWGEAVDAPACVGHRFVGGDIT